MRQAAERVLASLKRLDYSGADTAWRASRQRLLQQARDLVEAPPQGHGVLQHSSKGPGGQAVGDDDEIADEDTDDDGVDEDEDVAAAVARAAATAALVALPLEAEGRMWEEPRRKARELVAANSGAGFSAARIGLATCRFLDAPTAGRPCPPAPALLPIPLAAGARLPAGQCD